MLFAGIDIGKNHHEAALINSNGLQFGSTIRFTNSTSGTNTLLNAIKSYSNGEEVVIGLEATGHYWVALYSALLPHGFTIHVINPIQSDALRNLNIRKTKTDSVDCLLIAQVVRIGQFSPTAVATENMVALKQLCRFRFALIDSVSELKLKTIALLDQIFPEYHTLFSDTFGVTATELLLNHTTPDEIAALDTDKLAQLLSECSRGSFGIEKAIQIQSVARSSFGVKYALQAFSFQIRLLLEQIRFIESQVSALDQQMQDIYCSMGSFLHTIPGIGPVLAATILSEIGDVSRFGSDPAKLVAFAGIDPSVHQSGNFTGSHSHMSKRGSSYLRRAIWLAASVAYRYDPVLGAFYAKKRAEGKNHMTVMGALSRKLSYIIFAVLRDSKPYVPIPPKF